MPAVQIYQYAVVNLPGRPAIQLGSLSEARGIDLSNGEVADQVFQVAAETAVKVWDKTVNSAMGEFDFLWLESDLDLLVQFTTDVGGDDEYFVVELKGSGTADKMGPALVLGSDLAHQFDGAVDDFDGTEDTIDEIFVYNEDTENTAKVRRVVMI